MSERSQQAKRMSVSLFVRLWVEMLKVRIITSVHRVSLFVRLWVEILKLLSCVNKSACQPLREAVSWNGKGIVGTRYDFRQPLREAVSWNTSISAAKEEGSAVSLFVRLWVEMLWYRRSLSSEPCQPLREAVSWNNNVFSDVYSQIASASSWGCELKWNSFTAFWCCPESASSWGCELKFQ